MNLNRISSVLVVSLLFGLSGNAQEKTVPQSQVKKAQSAPASSDSSSGNFSPPAQIAGFTPTTSLDSSPQADTNEAEAGGLDAVKKQFDANFKELVGISGAYIKDNSIDAEKAAYKEYDENWSTCVDGQKRAAYACLSNLSPNIQDAVAAINTLGAAISSSVNDSCSTFGKAMGVAQAALTAYTAACGAAKGHCGWYCSSSKDAVAKMQKALAASRPECKDPTASYCAPQLSRYQMLQGTIGRLIGKELEVKDIKSIAGKSELCTSKYLQLGLSAATGIYGIANALKQGKQCDKDSSADGSSSTATTAETCAIAANANLPECLCLKNPMLEGCGSIAARAGQNASGSGIGALSAVSPESSKDGLSAASLAGGSGTGIDGAPVNRDPSSASGVGAPTGGGAGLGGGGGGFGSNGAAGTDGTARKALDTNILGGASGGGGGGGFFSGDSSGDKSGYRNYLPGGAKDPTKLGGQQNWTKEVTGQGGKSNWEKVRDRYQDNRPSLINN